MKNYIIHCFTVFIFFAGVAGSVQGAVLKGRVYDSLEKKPVDFALVMIPDKKIKTHADQDGIYTLEVDQEGTYTVFVRAEGYRLVRETLYIKNSSEKNFILRPVTVRGGALTITADRPIQKLSRRTMTVQNLKEVPASFGDSVNALTSLPGVIRTSGGFFGPLVIRGAEPSYNRYYVDGMPVGNPLHFFGLHSVIANDLMSEIDLYASSFPSEFGGPLAAVISINTLDTVKEFGGNADVGMISATALLKSPFTRERVTENGVEKENMGYLIAAGRVGYLTLLIPLFYELTTGEKLQSLPEYWDYQVKGKIYLNSRNSITMLCMGSRDYWKLLVDPDDVEVNEGDDPLFGDLEFDYDQVFHNQGLYYKYDSGKFRNTLMVYSAWSKHHTYVNAGSDVLAAYPDHWLKDFYVDSIPWTLGLKNNFKLEWIDDLAEIRGGLELTHYFFDAEGKELEITESGFIDPGDPDAVNAIPFDVTFRNTTAGGYAEQRFSPGGFIFAPSLRIEKLVNTRYYTIDPRGLASYEFPTETTLSAAGGHYSSFFQTNPFFFQFAPYSASQSKYYDPEKAWHCAAGIEQAADLITFNAEFFYNYYYDMVVDYPHTEGGVDVSGINAGECKTYGVELMVRRDRREGGGGGLFGWGSYTYTSSKIKSGLPLSYDLNGDKWVSSNFEQRQSVKIVMGYQYRRHTVSSKFQLYSSMPYTGIIGSEESPAGTGRYAPLYDNHNINEKHFPVDHRLDLRYSCRTGYEWGYVSWYIEIINVYGFWYKPENEVIWKYDRPYGNDNPTVESGDGLSVIPNFGVEVKF